MPKVNVDFDDITEFIAQIPWILVIGLGFHIAAIFSFQLSIIFGIITGIIYLLKVIIKFYNGEWNEDIQQIVIWAVIASVRAALIGATVKLVITNLQNSLTIIIGIIAIGVVYFEVGKLD